MLHEYDMGTGVRAFSTRRQGGVSTGNYASFNANWYCGDEPQHVEANRALLADALHIPSTHIVVPHQTHSCTVVRVDAPCQLEAVDALVTDVPGLCITVSTADCVPILLHDPRHHAIAAVHAGWRGTVARIVEAAVARMHDEYGTFAHDLQAVIGPSISLEAFEVGDEVVSAFADAGFPMHDITHKYQKWHIDLWACNRLQLQGMGVDTKNIHVAGICTYNHVDEFFSARRLGIKSGRILNGIMLQ